MEEKDSSKNRQCQENEHPETAEPPLRSSTLKTIEFRKKFYPNVSETDWQNWKWQIRNSITTYEELKRIFSSSENILSDDVNLPLRITPYYASLITTLDSGLGKCVIPTKNELIHSSGESIDPLDEEKYRHGCIIHKYVDRVLFISTNLCSTYCRYCVRSRIIDKEKIDWTEGLQYIKNHNEIKDVIISGGDGLLINIKQLDYLLNQIKNIKHVEIIRIGTKIPSVLPQKINNELINVLKNVQPIFVNIHITHPDELTPEFKLACDKLIGAGVILNSQTVLLKGVNDDIDIMEKLMRKMLTFRIRPYYLFTCDFILGSSHFRCDISKGVEIIKELRNRMSGLGIPNFIVDTKDRKIPILANYDNEINNYLYNVN